MRFLQLATSTVHGSNYLGHCSNRLVEVKYANVRSVFRQLNLVLLLDSLVQELRVAFLDLNERNVLMDARVYQRVSLVVVLHQHL